MWLLLASLLSAGAVTRAGGDTALDCAGIARRYVGRWTAPPTRVPTQKLVDGPILGNGDLGVTLGGPPEALTWYLGMNQFWALENWRHGSVGHNDLRPFPSPVQVAQVALVAPALAGSAYNLTQDIADGVVRAEFRGANGTLRVVSWVEPHNATVGATLTWDGARPLAARLTTSASAAICVNSSIDGPSGEEVCAPHSTMPVLASSGRSGDVAWVKRMASTPRSTFNITAAVGTWLITSRGSAIVGAAEDAPPPRVPTVSSASALVIPAGGQEVSVMTSVLTSHDLDASEPGVPPRGSNVDPLPALLRRIAAAADGGAARRSMAMAVEYQRRSWNTSCVSLPPELATLEQYWYGAIYSMGAASRAGKYPPGLWGPWITSGIGLAGWHGDYTLDYNYQAAYYGIFSSNRIEIADAFYAPLLDYAASGQAEQEASHHGCPGTYHFPSHIGAYGYDTTLAAMRWDDNAGCPGDTYGSLCISWNGIFAALPFLWRWEYALDKSVLAEHYPFLKKLVGYWDCHLEKGSDGAFHDHQDCGWECCGGTGPDNGLGDPDIAGSWDPLATVALLPRYYEVMAAMAGALGEPVPARWAAITAGLRSPAVWTRGTAAENQSGLLLDIDANRTVFGWQGRGFTKSATAMIGENPTNFVPVYPYEAIGQHSSSAELAIARDTIDFFASWTQSNGFCTVYPSCIHAGMVDCIPKFIAQVRRTLQPNLMAYEAGGGLEMSGALEAVNGMLLQSTGGFLSLFPVLPANLSGPVAFQRLRAKGAFVVSATASSSGIIAAEIESERGTRCVVALPAGATAQSTRVVDGDGTKVELSWDRLPGSGRSAFAFATEAGGRYRLLSKRLDNLKTDDLEKSLVGTKAALQAFQWVDSVGERRLGGRATKVCDITSYGARPGTTNSTHAGPSSTKAIQAAIDDCGSAGGGSVIIPEGTFVSGSLFLRSNITLYLSKNATLLGATAPDAWRSDASSSRSEYPWVYTRLDWWGMFRAGLLNGPRCTAHPRCPTPRQDQSTPHCGPNGTFGDLCTARERLHNVVVTGEGTIDGNARNPGARGGWWQQPHSANRPLLVTPSFIDGLTITGKLTFTGGANWQTHPMFCRHVWISGLTVRSVGVPNGDGIDPDSCSDVLIEDCDLATGDDCIAIKSGRNEDGLADNVSTQNVVIRNMHFQQGHGISIGSETSGGVHNVTLTNLSMDGTANGMRVKSAKGRGNSVTNILYENMVMRNIGSDPITVNMGYGNACAEWTGECALPVFANFTVRNVRSLNSGGSMNFVCLNDSHCSGFQFKNITLTGARAGYRCEWVYGTAVDVSPPMTSCLNRGGPPPKPPPAPPPAKHHCTIETQGQRCFDDTVSGSLLPVAEPATHDRTTLEVCASACFGGKHRLAGIDQGNHCFCGDEGDLTTASARAKNRPLAECQVTPCHADKNEKCGGTDRLLVYGFKCDHADNRTGATRG